MKLNMLKLAALLCCLMTFTACGDDEPDVQVNGTYTVTFSPDVLNVAEIIIYYKGNNNETKFEVITPAKLTNNTWIKNITTTARNKKDAELGVKFVISPNDESTYTKDEYDLVVNVTINGSISGGSSVNYPAAIIAANGVAKDKVKKTLQQLNDKSYGFKVGTDGIFKTANLDYSL